jgi:hypothetical protein
LGRALSLPSEAWARVPERLLHRAEVDVILPEHGRVRVPPSVVLPLSVDDAPWPDLTRSA